MTRRLPLPRPTVRLRLTLWYASIFLVAGTLMLGVAYVIVSRSLTAYYLQTEAEVQRKIEAFERAGVWAAPPESVSIPAPSGAAERRRYEDEERIRQEAERRAKAVQRRRVAVQFSLALGATTLLSLAAGWLVAGRALRPVAHITATARRVTDGRLDERIALSGPRDELKELADTFDTMLARLDAAFASQRRFVANASHELRTPLAVMRAAVDVTLDDTRALADPERMAAMADAVREGVDRSERLTESLLTLASSDRGLDRVERADLAALARAATDDLRTAVDPGIRIRARLGSAPVDGNPVLLVRMIGNLLENAARYNRPGGFVEVCTEARDGAAVLRVRNSGPRVDAGAVDSLVEPFSRREHDGGRAGLGLSIVRSVAHAHSGTLALAARPEGGLVVTLTLPVAEA